MSALFDRLYGPRLHYFEKGIPEAKAAYVIRMCRKDFSSPIIPLFSSEIEPLRTPKEGYFEVPKGRSGIYGIKSALNPKIIRKFLSKKDDTNKKSLNGDHIWQLISAFNDELIADPEGHPYSVFFERGIVLKSGDFYEIFPEFLRRKFLQLNAIGGGEAVVDFLNLPEAEFIREYILVMENALEAMQ